MATVALSASSPVRVRCDALVVATEYGPQGIRLSPGAEEVDRAFDGELATVLADAGATGAAGEMVRIPTFGRITARSVLGAGLGDGAGRYRPEQVRRAAGSAARALAGCGTVATTLARGPAGPPAPGGAQPDTGSGHRAEGATDLLAAVCEGLLLGAYRYPAPRARRGPADRPPLRRVTVLVPAARSAAARAGAARAQVIGDAVALARDLVNTPPATLTPQAFADTAAGLAGSAGIVVDVLDPAALEAGGYGGILAVGRASAHPPRLVALRYRGGPGDPTVALVGKGVTFDSGGLALKRPDAMPEMKNDMAGAAAVLAAVLAAAALQLPVHIDGWLPLAENMPGGAAMRPGDVLRSYLGLTVEVLNPDAEGRLLLADALARAAQDAPDVIVDVATLTGAQVAALGDRTSGVMGEEATRDAVVAAADRAGESMWPMPLPVELAPSLDSPVADLANMGEANGKMLVAGLFLQRFVPPGARWAHVDMAGPAYNSGRPYAYTPSGGTGHGVRTLVTFLEEVAAGRRPPDVGR